MGGVFGATFRGLFVFAYDVLGDRAPLPAEDLPRAAETCTVSLPCRFRTMPRTCAPDFAPLDTWAMPSADFRRLPGRSPSCCAQRRVGTLALAPYRNLGLSN